MDHQKGTVRHSRAVLFSLRRFELYRPSFASAKGTDNFLFAKQIDKAQPCRISGGSPKENGYAFACPFSFLLAMRRFELHRPSFASAKWQKIGVCLSNRRGGRPRPPDCHSEPTGEESHLVYFVLLEILRFAQDDKLGVVVIIICGRAGDS